jgi:glyoxylase-like metal-dependent hydrolase (beta-lactamase superfamily II)
MYRIAFFLIFAFTTIHARSQSATYHSFIMADSIIHEAIKSHGGLAKMKSLKSILLEYTGTRTMINQSREAYAPWDKEPSTGKVAVDLENNKMYSLSSNSYPGIGSFAGAYVVIADSGFHYEPAKNHMGDEVLKLTGNSIHSPWNYCKRWLPPLLLLQMLDDRTSLRYIGKYVTHNTTFNVLSYTQPNGHMMSIYFDSQTKYLRGFEVIRNDGVYGDIRDEGIYYDYQNFGGLMLPLKRIDYLNNEISRELSLSITVNKPIDQSLFEYPKGFNNPRHDETYQRVKKVADGVFIDQDMGGVLFVELDSFIIVFDCPGDFDMSYSTINLIRKTIPGKEIKYIVPSHTHGDHGGGARAYYYIGSTLITTPGHKKFYESLAHISQTIAPDSLALFPKKEKIEIFSAKRIIKGDKRSVVLYNAGPNAHSEELTFAYLQPEKIIWQSDIFFVPGTGNGINKAIPLTIEFAKKLKALKIDDFEYILDSHNSRLITRAQFAESLKMAGYIF